VCPPCDGLSPAVLSEVHAVLGDLVENRGVAARTAEARGVPDLLVDQV
jgi:hypothetical protein